MGADGHPPQDASRALLPPLAMIIGWFIDEAVRPASDPRATKALRWTLTGSLFAGALAAIALPIAGYQMREKNLRSTDIVIAIALFIGIALAWRAYRNRILDESMGAFAAVVAMLMPIVLNVWWPTLNASTSARASASSTAATWTIHRLKSGRPLAR